MHKFSVDHDKENIRVPAKSCQCVRKPTERGKAFQQLPSNIQIPASSTLQCPSRSSVTVIGTRRNASHSDCNSLAKREMINIFQAEQKQLIQPTNYSRSRPKSANDVYHTNKFRFDSFDHSSQKSRQSMVPPIRIGSACSTYINNPTEKVSRRPSLSSARIDRLYANSTENSKLVGSSRVRVPQHTASDPNRWYSLESKENTLSRQPRSSSHLSATVTPIPGIPTQRSAKVKSRASIRRCLWENAAEDEYAQDMIYNILKMDPRYTLPVGFLQYHGYDQNTRATFVDWMLGIQEYMHVLDAELYLAVNLFDQVLARSSIPTNMLQLLALVTIWVSNKFIGSDNLRVSHLSLYTNNSYTVSQILEMERKVLKILNCHIHYIEPSSCVEIYFIVLGLKNPEVTKSKAHYFLDCITLLADFSSTPVSVLAAAAVVVAIRMYDPNSENMVLYYFRKYMSATHNQKRLVAESQIRYQISMMKDENYIFKRAYYKNKKMKRV